jgi:hypothetical protein
LAIEQLLKQVRPLTEILEQGNWCIQIQVSTLCHKKPQNAKSLDSIVLKIRSVTKSIFGVQKVCQHQFEEDWQ